jgi:glycogen synthase
VPSLYESFGLIYLEAMAAGLAMVGGRGGGIPEVVADGETGFLVDANDGDVLLRRINELITNATLRAEMGVAGRARVEQRFSRQIMAQNTEQAYTEAIEKHRRSR